MTNDQRKELFTRIARLEAENAALRAKKAALLAEKARLESDEDIEADDINKLTPEEYRQLPFDERVAVTDVVMEQLVAKGLARWTGKMRDGKKCYQLTDAGRHRIGDFDA